MSESKPTVAQQPLSTDEIRSEVQRLAKAAAGDWCRDGGWQFPYDFGNGVKAPTYTEAQQMHIWRRDAMLDAVAKRFPGPREGLSVLDLGSGEGAMAIGLWEMGFRDITCVEVRSLNIEKAKFAARVFGAQFDIVQTEIADYLAQCARSYDLVLFMGILYHILDPFVTLKRIGELTKSLMILETVVALPKLEGFGNPQEYAPSDSAFYVRIDSNASHTAGLSDFELWPTRGALSKLVRYAGFASMSEIVGSQPQPEPFANKSRMMLEAIK
jgi:2-polyprenyl-3-methyl-5-hydroxy-6-metoxy-1,4-benzoquinol methylase